MIQHLRAATRRDNISCPTEHRTVMYIPRLTATSHSGSHSFHACGEHFILWFSSKTPMSIIPVTHYLLLSIGAIIREYIFMTPNNLSAGMRTLAQPNSLLRLFGWVDDFFLTINHFPNSTSKSQTNQFFKHVCHQSSDPTHCRTYCSVPCICGLQGSQKQDYSGECTFLFTISAILF